MAQLDMSTFMTQVFWLMIVVGVYYGMVEGEKGMKEEISRILKVRGKISETEEEEEKMEEIKLNVKEIN